MKSKQMKRIAVQTKSGVRYFRVPVDELNETERNYGNQVSTGIYCTDTYYSPRGRVIERMYSCWDDGRGCCGGTYYRLVEDNEELIREHDGYGLKDPGVDA